MKIYKQKKYHKNDLNNYFMDILIWKVKAKELEREHLEFTDYRYMVQIVLTIQ